jgi:hypothetical protein
LLSALAISWTQVRPFGTALTRLSQIKAAEDLQMLIRHLQEMWLFGPLNTVGESQVQQQTDESAKLVGELLRQLSSKQSTSTNGEAMNEES